MDKKNEADLRTIRDDEEKDYLCDVWNNVVVVYISVKCARESGESGMP